MRNSMKVVQINGAAKNGSTGKIVSQLSEVMTRQGIENYIITSGYKEKDDRENVFAVSNNREVKCHQLLAYLLGDAGFHSNKATECVIQILQNIKPDIVHLHHIYGYWVNVEKLTEYLKSAHVKVVWTIHDFWPITGHCTHFEAIGCEKWKTGCFECKQKRNYPYSLILDRSAVLYSRKKELFANWQELNVVTVSQWVERFVSVSFLKERDISVIPNGLDTKMFHQRNVGRKKEFIGKFIILGVAMSWSKKKGLDDFIKLAERLRSDELIVLIGLSEKQRTGLPSNIIGLPRTKSATELCEYYNLADVYVSASVEETMGLTVAEAMACGTPAVVYKETALTELITDGTGIAVEQDYRAIYAAISEIRKNGKQKYSRNCIAIVDQRYDKWKQYQKYCDYYRSVLGDI